ncbi:MAG: hypothetical protein IIV99_06015 [Oscillospiraceae bacterium]|nr:hypothetical protein [Oscillospiraceae bacterium]
MPKNTDSTAQEKRRRNAWESAVFSTLLMLLSAAVMLYLRHIYCIGTFAGAVLLIAALLNIGGIVPLWILLKTRLKEIEGGEEDVAAQY